MARRHLFILFILLPCLLTLSFSTLFSQIHADFVSASTTGCSPITVNFNNTSTGGATTWHWNLGNGTVSTLQNPSATYFAAGKYTVKLIASNGSASDVVTKTNFITVYASPSVVFGAGTYTGCYPLSIPFTDSSSAGDGTISTWQWDFGDGYVSNLQNPVHVYSNPGKFNVSLTIKNSFGCATTLTKQNVITITEIPIASFSVRPFPACTIPVNVTFNNGSSGSNIASYLWNFGDGQKSSSINPTHTYTTSGSYVVSLTVSSTSGCNDVTTKQTIKNIGAVKADFNMPLSVCEGVLFNITSNNPVHSYWTFGDGTTDTAANPQKKYNAAGTYKVKLLADYGGCSDSITKSIKVFAKSVASFTADKTAGCAPPFTTTFKNTSIDGTAVLWNFGDGTTSSSPNPTHTYNALGKFNVTLIIVNTNGCNSTISIPSFIQIGSPKITSIIGPPYKGCVPLSASFKALLNPPTSNVNYYWNFGDGNTSTSPNPTHIYNAEGTYDVTLITNDTNGGCSDTFKLPKTIMVGTKPHADFVANPLIACPNEDVYFTSLATGGPDQFLWYFGDNGTSTLQNPIHNYGDTGFNKVVFIAMRNGCADTAVKEAYIYIKPPIAIFTDSFICGNQFQHYFIDHSIGAITYLWHFGDGDSSTLHSPTHLYTDTGHYKVTLLVANGTCQNQSLGSLLILNEHANFSTLDSIGCGSTIKQFTPSSTPAMYISSYLWDFGDGSKVLNTTNSPISYDYIIGGTFNAKLTITDVNNCTDSISKPILVKRYKPTAKFSVSQIFCKNTAITFNDSSFSDSSKIVKWIWDFGDTTGLHSFDAPPFTHNYTSNGSYNVVLTITNSLGCSDATHQTVTIKIIGITADFSTPKTVRCLNTNLNFQNLSSGALVSSLWEFGDGTTSTDTNPLHSFSLEKLYTIKLTVVDTSGCRDTLTKTDYIQITNPHAFFTMSDSASTCPPFLLKLTNQSTGYASMSWDFGDGNTSIVTNPSHTYILPGIMNVKLLLVGTGGCNDSTAKQIRLGGPNGTFTYSPTFGCSPLSVNFSNKTFNTKNFTWDFDDGFTVKNANTKETHLYPRVGTYLPKIILQDSAGCSVPIYGTDSITVKGVDVFIKDLPTYLICDSGSVAFEDLSITNDTLKYFYWDFGDGQVSNDKSPVHVYNITGNYNVTHKVTTNYGCSNTATLIAPIKIVPSPQIKISGPDSLCVMANAQFNAQWLNQDTSTIQWFWDFNNGKTAVTQTPALQFYPNAGNYNVVFMATNGSDCADTIKKVLAIFPLPIVNAGPNRFICFGQSGSLTATGAKSYVWDPQPSLSCTNCYNPVVTPTHTQLYNVTGTDSHGCKARDSILIQVKFPFAMAVGVGDTLCFGQSFQLQADGAEAYIWSPSLYLNNPFISNPLSTPDSSIAYRVIGHDTIGCFYDTGFIKIKVYPIPKINIIEDRVTVSAGSTIQLHTNISSDVTLLRWSPPIGLSCSDCPDPMASPKEDITYTVTATNDGGCMAQDKVDLLVVCNQGNIYVPNTFSPNNDGVNDVFYPRGKGLFGIKAMRIFSRWGELMYEKTNFQPNDISSGWDGTYKGRKLTPDVFVYLIEVICDNNQVFSFKGNVTLML